MDELINNFWEANINYYDDIDIDEKQIMLCKLNNFKLKCAYNSDVFNIHIQFNSKIKLETKLDIIKFINNTYDADITNEIYKYNLLTSDAALFIIKTVGNLGLLNEELTWILPGYMPVDCDAAIIYNLKNKYKDNYNFIINVLLKECFSVIAPSDIHLELLNKLPGYLMPLLIDTYTKIRIGLTNIAKFETEYILNPSILLSATEYELEMYKTSQIGYEVIKYALLNFNEYMLKKVDNSEIGIENETITVYKVENNNPVVNAKFDELQNKDGYYGYHGSNIINWYNIVLNNLIVAQNKFIVNGAAYGNGIYMSNDCGISMTYSSKHGSESNIIGVYQCDNPIGNYKKNEGIYVIPSAANICLRYLIYVKGSRYKADDMLRLNNYFIKGQRSEMEHKKVELVKTVWSRRVMDEIRELYKRDCIMCDDGVKFCVDNVDSMNIITLNIFRETFTGSELFNDMEKFDINFIKIEIRLSDNYPFEPPFIRIVNPKFAYRKGHITTGGSICMDLLTKQCWTPSMVILTTLIQIVHNIISWGGRLDPNGANYEYSLYEAQQSFTYMLKTHALEWNTV